MSIERYQQPQERRRMTNAEAVMLCRYARAACPQQKFDEYTPDAWGDLLADLRFDDCQEALKNIVKRQPFVAPAEIREEVKAVRNERLRRFDSRFRYSPPRELADNPDAEVAWGWAVRDKIADGIITHPSQIAGAEDRRERVVEGTSTPEFARALEKFGEGMSPKADPIVRERALAEARAALRTRSDDDDA